MAIVGMWLRIELRRRWRSLAVLALLIALATGTVFTAVAGARRTASAVDRLLNTTLPADVIVYGATADVDWAPVRALPEVAALATVNELGMALDGVYDADDRRITRVLGGQPTDNEPVEGRPLPPVLTTGVAPSTTDEIVLTPGIAGRLDAGPGSSVRIAGDLGERTFRVTGIGFTLEGTGPDVYNDGAWVSGRGYDVLFEGYEGYGALYATHPGTDPEAVAVALRDALGALPGVGGPQNVGVFPQPPPFRLGEIRTVAVLPVLLAAFLAVLALGAVGHALSTAVRRRSADLAVLRALGMTRAQCRGVVATQASVLAGVGLLFGVPLGVALGRAVWRLVADTTPLVYRPPDVVWALLLIVPLALLATNLLAAVPGRRAARLRVAALTRAE